MVKFHSRLEPTKTTPGEIVKIKYVLYKTLHTVGRDANGGLCGCADAFTNP